MTHKLSIAAGVLGATLGYAAMTMPAAADVDVDIHLGAPHFFDHRVGPGFIFRPGFGWFMPSSRYYSHYDRLSCSEARRLVREHGYKNVSSRDCQGSTYSFRATRKGETYRVYVNARTGNIWRA